MIFENVGISPLTVLSMGAPSDAQFGIRLTEGTAIEPGSSIGVPFSFKPFSAGAKSATVVIQTDSAANSTVTLSLSGRGVVGSLVAEPPVVDFGSVAVHAVASRVVSIANDYPVVLTIIPSAVGGTASSLYSLDTAPDVQFTLPAGTSRTISVDYAPLVPSASDTGSFVFSSNVGDEVVVGLKGSAR
jgi:hypothetical protein